MSIHAAERKRVAISGASGFIGTRLCRYLEGKGHRVYRLVRHPAQRENEIPWSPQEGIPLLERLEPLDAVIHLAGKNIADGRWTSTRKAEIHQSRVEGTLALSRTLLALPHPPQVLLSASAIGFYGDRQDTPVDEDSPPGSGFLAEVCRQWEAAAQPARDAGIRVVHPRIGVVLSTEGGALAKMLLPFRWGLGGPTGPGTQFMSWIALADLLRAFHFCMQTESIQGPVNFTAPHPVT
ncbi:MAG: TIGR01777 family oxidoreductase, partial [bacterium]|nr:TIGR01777 family oxidoreductase [bacterium]